MSVPRTWFITGASRGFGRIWAETALGRGDGVAATARDVGSLERLVEDHGDLVLPLELDLTVRSSVEEAVAAAEDHFDGLDIVVNNAGGGLIGSVEEVGADEVRAVMETNFFGPLWVVKAALPRLRRQGSGHILQISSIGGVHAFAGAGLYCASKWGMEAYSQALAEEVSPFGIKVTLIEPVGFTTGWVASATRAMPMSEYEVMRGSLTDSPMRTRKGDPRDTAPAILELVDAEEPPLRVFFGDWALEMTRNEYAARIETWERWDDLAQRSHVVA